MCGRASFRLTNTEKKESVIGAIKKYKRNIDKTVEQSHSRKNEIEL